MSNDSIPNISNKSLIKALLMALLLALLVLITMILPAEYNIDPLGTGKAMGLTQLSNNTAAQQSQKAVAQESSASGFQNDEVVIEVAPGKGLEYKFYLEQYQSLSYSWQTDGADIYFDFHGEPKDDTSGYFESYSIASANQAEGTITTPFAGTHGWYFKNNTSEPISITLNTQGVYELKGFVQ